MNNRNVTMAVLSIYSPETWSNRLISIHHHIMLQGNWMTEVTLSDAGRRQLCRSNSVHQVQTWERRTLECQTSGPREAAVQKFGLRSSYSIYLSANHVEQLQPVCIDVGLSRALGRKCNLDMGWSIAAMASSGLSGYARSDSWV